MRGYFRGHRGRGQDGYGVLEVIIDLNDIMSAPGYGRAQRQHFEQVLGEARGQRRTDFGRLWRATG